MSRAAREHKSKRKTGPRAPWDNSPDVIHSMQPTTGRARIRLWIGGDLKLRLSSPAPIRDAERGRGPLRPMAGASMAAVRQRDLDLLAR